MYTRTAAGFWSGIAGTDQRAGSQPSAPLVVLSGGTPAYLFVVQMFTGILLAFYYQPAPTTAYESVRYITNEVTYGWYFRSMHKWAATLMIAAVILHQMRVYFTGAFRRPRELNWIVGMCLLLVTMLIGFTGYKSGLRAVEFLGNNRWCEHL